jgi:hypothetical protein
VAVAAGTFALAAFAGLRVVPALEDQDSEVQGTAWGLVHDLEPTCLTNRGTLYYFAHPPLLHGLVASTLTLSRELPAVRPAYEAARRELERIPMENRRGPRAIAAALRGESPRPDRYLRWRRDVYGGFVRNPALLGTRAPNFALSAVAAVLVFLWVRRLGVGSADAALVTATHVTLPEIFVRSGYGGYHAIVSVTTLAAAWLFAAGGGGGRSGFAAGALAALADHKTLLLGVVAGAVTAFRGAAARSVQALRRAGPLLAGMACATAAFWAWGLAIAPDDFVSDHVREHGLARLAGGDAAPRAGAPEYPSRLGLWAEFASHSGPWTAIALVAFAAAARRARRGNDEIDRTEEVLVGWIAAGAMAFTLVDWRQTKHLCLLVPAASVLIGGVFAAGGPRGRVALRMALVLALAWNVSWLVRLAGDFQSMAPRPMW